MKYEAWSMQNDDGGSTSHLPVVSPKCEHDSKPLAERHARAMKAVLLAVKAWAKSCGEPQRGTVGELSVEYTRRMRLLSAQERLAKIEKEVARG